MRSASSANRASRAVAKKAARREARLRLDSGETPAVFQRENSIFPADLYMPHRPVIEVADSLTVNGRRNFTNLTASSLGIPPEPLKYPDNMAWNLTKVFALPTLGACMCLIDIGCGKKGAASDMKDGSARDNAHVNSKPTVPHRILVDEGTMIADVTSLDEAISKYGKPDSIIPSDHYGAIFEGVHSASVVLNYDNYNSRLYVKSDGDIIAIKAICPR